MVIRLLCTKENARCFQILQGVYLVVDTANAAAWPKQLKDFKGIENKESDLVQKPVGFSLTLIADFAILLEGVNPGCMYFPSGAR